MIMSYSRFGATSQLTEPVLVEVDGRSRITACALSANGEVVRGSVQAEIAYSPYLTKETAENSGNPVFYLYQRGGRAVLVAPENWSPAGSTITGCDFAYPGNLPTEGAAAMKFALDKSKYTVAASVRILGTLADFDRQTAPTPPPSSPAVPPPPAGAVVARPAVPVTTPPPLAPSLAIPGGVSIGISATVDIPGAGPTLVEVWQGNVEKPSLMSPAPRCAARFRGAPGHRPSDTLGPRPPARRARRSGRSAPCCLQPARNARAGDAKGPHHGRGRERPPSGRL